jgi:hypothetical protein
VPEMEKKAGRARPGFESGEEHLVERDDSQPSESNSQRVMVKERNAEKNERKENEIDRNPEEKGKLFCQR